MKYRKLHTWLNVSLMGALLMWGMSGCAKDKTLDDYRNEKVNQELVKFQYISGTYRGEIKSNQDSRSIGQAELVLEPDLTIGLSSDGTVPERHVGLKGKLKINGVSKSFMAFDTGFYDSVGKQFKLTRKINVSGTNEPIEIEILGNIEKPRITGTLEAAGYSEFGANFTFEQDAPVSASPQLPTGGSRSPYENSKRYLAAGVVLQGGGEPVNLELTLVSPNLTAEEIVLDIISPVKNINGSLRTNNGGIASLPDMQLDLSRGTLVGNASSASGGKQVQAKISCTQETQANGDQALNCIYETSLNGRIFQALFIPQKNMN